MMDNWIRSFPTHIKEASALLSEIQALRVSSQEIHHVVSAGMGGSAIGADLAVSIARDSISAPVVAVRGYSLPAWASSKTLVIVSSYSGNTEETLSVLEDALARGCKIIGIGSGGTLENIAAARDFDFVKIPGGLPPRAALGYSLTAQLGVFAKVGIIAEDLPETLTKAADQIAEKSDSIRTRAVALLESLDGKMPVFYGSRMWNAVLTRWRHQMNENGKALAWSNVFPELNHNELVGWEFERKDIGVLLLRSSFDHPRTSTRMDISTGILEKQCGTLLEVQAHGQTLAEQILWLIHLGDWLSYEWATRAEVDPIAIRVIDYLKAELSKIS